MGNSFSPLISNFKNHPSHHYDVSKEAVDDVKWDQLIYQKQQLQTSKISYTVHVTAMLRIRLSSL
jgi:hypothetical protein